MSSLLIERIASLQQRISSTSRSRDIDPEHLQQILGSARSIILDLDGLSEPADSLGNTEWINLISTLQDIAYLDPDNGGAVDVALWCERQWATVLQSDPENVVVLQKLGHAWLLKSQSILARIHRNEGSSSSGESDASAGRIPFRVLSTTTDSEDTARINSSDYIEARASLQPSIEFLDRAIEAGDQQRVTTGELLERAAEAYMSFANVSHPRNNEAYYQKALAFLLRASHMEDYEMNEDLRSFLERNVELMD